MHSLTFFVDYADNSGLQSSRHNDMEEEMDKLTTTTPQIELKLNTAKNLKLLRNNNKTYNPIITINSDALEEVHDFIHMGRKITTEGDSAKMPCLQSEKSKPAFRYDEVYLQIQETVIGTKTENVRQ